MTDKPDATAQAVPAAQADSTPKTPMERLAAYLGSSEKDVAKLRATASEAVTAQRGWPQQPSAFKQILRDDARLLLAGAKGAPDALTAAGDTARAARLIRADLGV